MIDYFPVFMIMLKVYPNNNPFFLFFILLVFFSLYLFHMKATCKLWMNLEKKKTKKTNQTLP